VDTVTAREREQYEADVVYWAEVRKHAVNFKDPGMWAA
jgi:hypothetical protein